MMAAGLILSPDIGKHLDYLEDAGYIEYTDEKVTAYTAYAKDAVIKLTKKVLTLRKAQLKIRELISDGKEKKQDKSEFQVG